MKKTFCDICGKEISGVIYSMSLKVNKPDCSKDRSDPYTTAYWYDAKFNLDNADVCSDCAQKIHDYIKS